VKQNQGPLNSSVSTIVSYPFLKYDVLWIGISVDAMNVYYSKTLIEKKKKLTIYKLDKNVNQIL